MPGVDPALVARMDQIQASVRDGADAAIELAEMALDDPTVPDDQAAVAVACVLHNWAVPRENLTVIAGEVLVRLVRLQRATPPV